MEKYENEYVKIWIEQDVFHIVYLTEHYTEQMIDHAIKIKFQVNSTEKWHPVFSDIRKAKSFTREARKRFADKDSMDLTSAVAVLINSRIQEVMFNFFKTIFKVPMPTKMFTDEKKAIAWLQQFNIRTE